MIPIVKWAGGKRQILPEIVKSLPDYWNTYIEPFSGGLALFCYLSSIDRINKAILADTNPELVNLYVIIKTNPDELIKALDSSFFVNSEEKYYENRQRFNDVRGKNDEKILRSACFLYLNKHCYNGLWRVNNKGEFNVPFGKYKNPTISKPHEIYSLSKIFANATIIESDFEAIINMAEEGDFVYCDPPYHPVSVTSHFTSYTNAGFTIDDQRRLTEKASEMKLQGVNLLLSNSDTPVIHELYSSFNIRVINASRMINSKADRRKGSTEILASTYAVSEKQKNALYIPQRK